MPKDMTGIFDFIYTTLGLGRQRKQVPNTKHTRDRELWEQSMIDCGMRYAFNYICSPFFGIHLR